MAKNSDSITVLRRLFQNEAAPGLVLIACAAVALVIANSPSAHSWHALFHGTLPWTPIGKLDNLHLWINDGLMAIFFFVVGLEIKREVLHGALADARKRRLPVVAALAGMAMPALVFLAIAGREPGLGAGWAIPAATDIAFAVGVLALLGSRVPPSLRLFLLTVAIVDDLGAVAVIALFYTTGLELAWVGAAAAILGIMIVLNRLRVTRWWPYVLLAIILWYAVLHSGVHATVAGVLAAFTIPMVLDKQGDCPLLRLEHALVAPNGFIIVPLFGLANAGVELGEAASHGLMAPLPLGIAAGLFLGKQAGILGSVLLCERLGIGQRPAGTTVIHLWGLALLCGIGFTMSLFIGALAFPADRLLVEEAKLGVLGGSLLSAIGGALVLRTARAKPRN